MVYDALRNFLLSDTSIVALIGTRAFPIKLPQGSQTPAITITPVSHPRSNVLDDYAPISHPRFQIDCWVQEQPGLSAFQQARELGSLIRARLEAYYGVMLDQSVSPAREWLCWVHFDDERESFEGDVSGGFYRHSSDFIVWNRPVRTA